MSSGEGERSSTDRGPAAWAVACGLAIVAAALHRRMAPESSALWPSVVLQIVVPLAFLAAFVLATARSRKKAETAAKERESVIASLLAVSGDRAEELSSARDVALSAAQAKGEFLAVMSHEIRTPLNAVLGLAGVLLDAQLPPEQHEIVRMIRSSGDTLLALVNDVLDFSKIEAGRLVLEEAPFDVRDCMEDALDLFAAVAAEKEIELSCHASPELPTSLQGDAARVRQILVNFASNAVKFTPRGSIELHADASPIAGEPDHMEVHCWVKDTGIGVPEDRLQGLFEAFSQADASTTRRFGGTGLGLAICRSLAERMAGRVWAESAKGRGSTFHFAFPARAVGLTETREISLSRLGGSALVVSSRDGTRSSVSAQVEALGLAVTPCATLESAAAALREAPVTLVIADEASAGSELREALAGLEPRPGVLLLVGTGRDAGQRKRLREAWPGARSVSLPARRVFLREAVVQLLRGAPDEELPTRDSGIAPLAEEIPLRMLVAEDNPVNQRVMQLLLDRLGYRPDLVGNGAEAVDAVSARPYDLVLMDLRMPEMDGLEATRAIRRSLRLQKQPRIVALTANVTREDRLRCEEAGMDDFLGKPVMTADLVRAIRASTGSASATGSASGVQPSSPPAWGPGENDPLEELRRITKDDAGMFEELIDSYLKTSQRLMGELREALRRGDARTAARSAHTLKGSAGQLGAAAVTKRAAEVQHAAEEGAIERASQAFVELCAQQEATARQLAREKNRH